MGNWLKKIVEREGSIVPQPPRVASSLVRSLQ